MTDALSQFMEPFSARARAAVDAARSAGAAIELADPGLAEFRRDPGANLAVVAARLHELWSSAPAPGVVWCLSGTASHGLDDFEVPAILGRELHLDLVEGAYVAGEKRVVAVGTLRTEAVAVAVRAPEPATTEGGERWFEALAVAAARPAVAFVTAELATRLVGAPSAVTAVRKFISGGGALGWWVPISQSAAVIADPHPHLAVVAELGGQPVRMVRFESMPADAPALDRFMRETGLVCDTSMVIDDGAAPRGVTVRPAAYAGASPYRPQPFDLRNPWFQTAAGAWFELPMAPITASGLAPWWLDRRGLADRELAGLLDNTKMEAFFRASRINPAEEEHYPEIRIYNWPAAAPQTRVSLLDGGELPADAAVALAGAVGASVRQSGPRARLVTQAELLTLAAAEVEARYAISSTRAIAAQNEAHEYLATVPHEAPLRPDYADFARFVAADLGDALELGSGYGVLAWALSLRSRRYTCVDLDRHMFTDLRPDLGQAGLVADLHQLPFAGAAFDSVVANNVLEHLYDPLAGLREVRRILKPGGRLFGLLPFDALNSRHALPAHLWKLDEMGLRLALEAAGFAVARLDVVHLNELGVVGAFPTCHGLAAMFDAVNPEPGRVVVPAGTRRVPASPPVHGLPGRLLPAVREAVGFERWPGRRVLTVGSDQSDIDEFTHFGAVVTAIAADTTGRWPVADGSVDLVFAFLTMPAADLADLQQEIRRVLAPGGTVIAGFRNRLGLRYQARVRSYLGEACDLTRLLDADAAVEAADDDGARHDADYVRPAEVAAAFADFSQSAVQIRGLTPEDLPGARPADREHGFWTWLSHTCGRFILLKATK